MTAPGFAFLQEPLLCRSSLWGALERLGAGMTLVAHQTLNLALTPTQVTASSDHKPLSSTAVITPRELSCVRTPLTRGRLQLLLDDLSDQSRLFSDVKQE